MCCGDFRPKTLRYTNGCLTVVALILLIVVLVLSVAGFSSYKSGLHFFEATVNWYREPILDVTVVDPTSGVCQNDQQDFFDYSFKGMKLGCDCTASNGGVTTGKCNTSTQSSCQNVAESKAATFQNWVDSSYKTIRLCFKRLPGYKYYQKYLTESKCRDPINEKMCGGTNPLYAFCVPSTSKCPVQSISTSQVNLSDEQIGTTGLWIQRDQPDMNHLSEAQVGSTSGICYSTNYKYSADPKSVYKLLEDDKFEKCEIDSKYTSVQQIMSAQFYNSNGLTSSTFPGLVTGELTGLFQRKYITWKMECRQGDDFEKLVDVSLDFANDANTRSTYWKIAAANVGFVAVYGLFLLLGCFTTQSERKCCSFKNCCKTDCCLCCCCKNGFSFSGCCTLRMPQCIRQWWIKKSYEPTCTDYCYLVDPLHIILIIIKFALDIALLALAFKNLAKEKSYSGDLADLAAKQCSDKMVNDSLTETSENIKTKVGPLDIVILIIMIIYFIGSLIAVGTYIKNQVHRRRAILKKKLDENNSRSLQEKDQSFPTILTNYNDQNDHFLNDQKQKQQEIQMQQNPYYVPQNNQQSQPNYPPPQMYNQNPIPTNQNPYQNVQYNQPMPPQQQYNQQYYQNQPQQIPPPLYQQQAPPQGYQQNPYIPQPVQAQQPFMQQQQYQQQPPPNPM